MAFPSLPFHPVELNLRDSFRALAESRAESGVFELPGVSIASAGVRFQMFNAAFLSAPVADADELDRRLRTAAEHFRSRDTRWSFWICEDWLAPPVRRVLSRRCERMGLCLSAEMPGMRATRLTSAKRSLPDLEYRRVESAGALADFHAIGSVCFHVPMLWFTEVFDADTPTLRSRFRCYVAYRDGLPVATAAVIRSGGTLGLYNIATAPEHRKRGIAEAITRYAVEAEGPAETLVLQSTAHGYRLYERLGFRSVTRILVYTSMP